MKAFSGIAAVLAAAMWTGVAEAKPASCNLTIADREIFDGTCDFDGDADGSFRLTYAGDFYFVYVSVMEPGVAKGFWNGYEKNSHAHDDLGTLQREDRDRACWSNGYARVCAR
ncbi:hypothetical protein MLD63_06740 [Paracoccus sp. TK19116]|uniref:Uncharacterized protein n=1 Tax=Paracoccus albicereus TaxID=2922394 RepID=A0ABT1MPJ9_9RHOB|nr:hypothetical protein [Paracoccus albicereus]MCQ0970121.1 hypothetical protein [Paracoccus albicereus]